MPDAQSDRRAEALAHLEAGHQRLLGIHRTHPSPDLQNAIDILSRIIGEDPHRRKGKVGRRSSRLWTRVTRRRDSATPASQLTAS